MAGQVTDVERQVAGGVWFPRAVLAELQAAVRAAPRGAVPDSLCRLLPAALTRHAELAVQQSDLLQASAMA